MWQKYLLVRLLHLHGDFVNALAVVNNMIFVLVNIDLCQQTATWVNIVNKVAFFQYVMYSEIPLLLCVSWYIYFHFPPMCCNNFMLCQSETQMEDVAAPLQVVCLKYCVLLLLLLFVIVVLISLSLHRSRWRHRSPHAVSPSWTSSQDNTDNDDDDDDDDDDANGSNRCGRHTYARAHTPGHVARAQSSLLSAVQATCEVSARLMYCLCAVSERPASRALAFVGANWSERRRRRRASSASSTACHRSAEGFVHQRYDATPHTLPSRLAYPVDYGFV